MTHSFELFKAKRYNKWFEEHVNLYLTELRVLKSMNPQKPALEVGVGTGRFASLLGVEFGVDPSLSMLQEAKRRGVMVVRGVGESLPFRDGAFREVLLVVTICFLERPKRVYEEVRRVLVEDGFVTTCFIPKSSPWGIYYQRLAMKGHPIYREARFYDVHEVKELLAKAGFEVVEAKGAITHKPPLEVLEEPSPHVEDKSFVCLKAKRLQS